MEENQSVFKTSLNAGLLFGLIIVVFNLLLFVTDLAITSQGLTWISYLILAGGIFYAHNQFKKKGDGFMSYAQGLGIGTLVSLFAGVLSGIFSVVYTTLIDTGYQERAMEQARIMMEEQGMPDEQIESALEMSQTFTNPILMLVVGIIVMTFLGFLISLVVAAITKKNDPAAEI